MKIQPTPPVFPKPRIPKEKPKPQPKPKEKWSDGHVKSLCEETLSLMTQIEGYKAAYSRLDVLSELLLGQSTQEYGIAVVDNFADKNVVWKPCGVRRYEIKKIK